MSLVREEKQNFQRISLTCVFSGEVQINVNRKVDLLKKCLEINESRLMFTKNREISISLFEKLSSPGSVYLPSV